MVSLWIPYVGMTKITVVDKLCVVHHLSDDL